MHLGSLISELEDETVALESLLALGDLALAARVRSAAEVEGLSLGEYVAAAVGRFANGADHEQWLSLMSAVGRAPDPGRAGLKCILEYALMTRAACKEGP
jgi:hypothetical protein